MNMDWQRVNEVLHNFLKDAVAHTPMGDTINVTAYAKDKRVEASVSDTDQDVLAEDLPHSFEYFYTVVRYLARAGG
jgi:signal transduction histidine kinase